MSHEDERLVLAVSFTLREVYRVLGKTDEGLYSTTDELVAALSDKEVHELLAKLTKMWQ